jgi:hypothetical protein
MAVQPRTLIVSLFATLVAGLAFAMPARGAGNGRFGTGEELHGGQQFGGDR